MKLSTKGRYGLLSLGHLVSAYPEKTVSLSEIAESEGLSVSYLEQLFRTLKKSGIVESSRGAHGGYRLSKNPVEITIYDALSSLEGTPVLSCRTVGDLPCRTEGLCSQSCRTEKLLDLLQGEVDRIFSSHTLWELGL